MDEVVFFKGLATKGLQPINSSERYFEGYLTVQIKDKQGEVTIVDELMKVLPVWIDRGAPISDTHSNRIIGKGINYAKVEYKDKDGEIYPAIKITGKIHKNYELDTDIWSKIKSGEYKGLSFGGATKSDREPIRMKDGSIAYSLKDLEHYEVAVCRDPAVPLALITDFNPLAKATTMGKDIGNGRMLIKCDKFGCYVDKNNKEGGQIEPALAHEETVRETETHNPKSMDHPIELETKGNDDPLDKLIREQKDPKKKKDLLDRQGKQETAAQDAAVAQSDRADRDSKKGATIIADPKGKPFCPSCGRSHRVEDAKNITADKEDPTLMVSGTGGGNKPSCPNCGYRSKGEDWSNADGDRHSMYNQDTDEGGMGKHRQKGCKCGDPKCKDPKCEHKREVGTGYGAEQNADGEVQWTGSGSPYPKKRKSIITNIYSRLKSLDFLLRKEPLLSNSWEAVHIDQEEQEAKKKKKRLKKDAIRAEAGGDKPIKGYDNEKQTKEGQATDARSKLDGMGISTRGRTEGKRPTEGSKPKVDPRIPRDEQTTEEKREADTHAHPEESTQNVRHMEEGYDNTQYSEGTHAKYGQHWDKTMGEVRSGKRPQPLEPSKLKPEDRGTTLPKKKKAIMLNMSSRLKNIQTRIAISDFLLRDFHEDERREIEAKREQKRSQSIHGDFTGRPEKMTPTPEQIANKKIRDEKETKITADKKEKRMRGYKARELNRRKKEGEFGGMNTGEVEWTEPRQTANDRTERDRKEKAEEGWGQSMLHGAQRGLGHDGGSKQGSGESTQVTEVKEEKDKSAYENHEQDGSNKKQIPHSNVDTTETTNI